MALGHECPGNLVKRQGLGEIKGMFPLSDLVGSSVYFCLSMTEISSACKTIINIVLCDSLQKSNITCILNHVPRQIKKTHKLILNTSLIL